MFQKLQKKKATSPKTILGLTTVALVGSGLYATTAEASTTYYVTASSLNVRSGAGTNFSRIGGLTQNQSVTVSSISNGWATISFNGRTGYVSAEFLSTSNSSGGSSSGSSSSSSTTYYVTASSLNVRSGAGTNHSRIGSLTLNQSVSVSSISNGWATISFNGRTAFVSSEFLSTSSPSGGGSSSGNSSSSSTTYFVTASSLNVRSGAGTNHSRIGSLTLNQSVSVSSISNGWATISYNGQTAFVSAEFLSTSSPSGGGSSSGSSSSSSTTYFVTANSLNVRSGAGTNHSRIGSLTLNQSVSVSSISNGWATISYNGQTAFVSAEFLSTSSPSGGSGSSGGSSSSNANAAQIVSFAQQFTGVPYVWGGASPSGFDCSGFIYYVFRQNGVSISRTNVAGYWSNNTLFQTVSSPQAGDLIFFQNTYTTGPSHMGIMINSTQFIHAGSGTGVTTTNISNSYWSQHFLGYKRLR